MATSKTPFSDAERAALRERAREATAAAAGTSDGCAEVLAKIAEMAEPDRTLAGRFHALVQAAAPALAPRLWYGMPAYAKEGKVLCFFQAAAKFKTRYATLGFSDVARLDDGALWPTAFAVADWTDAVEARVRALVQQAAG